MTIQGCDCDCRVFLRIKCQPVVDSDGLPRTVQRHEDVRTVFHDAHQQVINVLLQLRYLLVPVRQLLVLFEHQRDELGPSQLGIRSFGGVPCLRRDARTSITDIAAEKQKQRWSSQMTKLINGPIIKPLEVKPDKNWTLLWKKNCYLCDISKDFCGFFIPLEGGSRWSHRAEGFHR